MAKEVVWAISARSEKDRVLKFWIKKTGSNNFSLKLENLINQIVLFLSLNPQLGKPTNYKAIRVITFSYYQVFYRVSDRIEILVFWDTRQDPRGLESKFKRE